MLQSLERTAGIPIAFDPVAGAIRLTDALIAEQTSVRTAEEMRLYTKERGASATQHAIYSVYRSIRRRVDAAALKEAGLRYDITVIPPGYFIGESKEFFRTAGHYHVLPPGRAVGYPEVYEVLSGRAYWLIQRSDSGDPSALEEIYLVEAGPGEKALIPPHFGHISINPMPEPLVMANWIAEAVTYDYAPFRDFRGGGYWVLEGEDPDMIEFEKNANYKNVPELQKLRPKEVHEFGLRRRVPAHNLVSDLSQLEFLRTPERFTEFLTIDHCYQSIV